MSKICRGAILYAELDPIRGSEQAGCRPVVVIQTFLNSSMILIAPVTSKKKGLMRTHVSLKGVNGLDDNSIALLEQIRSIDKERISKVISMVSDDIMEQLMDTYDAMGIPNFEKEPLQMTLCGICASEFCSAKKYLKRVDYNQEYKEVCTYCDVRQGWDYLVYGR